MKIFITLFFLSVGFLLTAATFNLDEDKNGTDERWITCDLYKDWRSLDRNNNDQADESWFFVSGKKMVYLISVEKLDSTGKGVPNITIYYSVKGKNVYKEIHIDTNEDKQVDMIRYEINDFVYLQKTDENFDGKYDNIEEYNDTGVRIKESKDKILPDEFFVNFYERELMPRMNQSQKNIFNQSYAKKGNSYLISESLTSAQRKTLYEMLLQFGYNDQKMDDFYYFDEQGNITREEHDLDGDGKMDEWSKYEYDTKGGLKQIVIQKDNNKDGKPDEWHYTNSRREVVKVEKSTKFDGVKDYVKTY